MASPLIGAAPFLGLPGDHGRAPSAPPAHSAGPSGKPQIVERAFQLMPNHFHGAIGLQGDSGTLGQLINTLKGRATREARAAGALGTTDRLWHRGYHARWLPDEGAVRRAVAYVENNPKRR